MRIVVGARFVATALRDGLGALHHKRVTYFTHASRRLRLDSIFTLRIVGARKEDTEATPALHHFTFGTDRAGDAGFCTRFFCGVFADIFTLWKIRARDESAETPFTLHQLTVFTFRTRFADVFWRSNLRAIFFARAEACREFCTAHEATVF